MSFIENIFLFNLHTVIISILEISAKSVFLINGLNVQGNERNKF